VIVAIAGVAALSLGTDALLWSGLSLVAVGVAVLPPLARYDVTEMLPWEVLAVLAVAVALRPLGLLGTSAGFVAAAALALAVAVELDAFTALELTGWFSVPFVAVTTTALAGLWAIVQYASDALLGSSLVGSNYALMWNLVLAAGVGVGAGLLFRFYVREFGRWRDGDSREVAVDPVRTDRVPLSESRLRYPVRAMQIALALVVGYALVTRNPSLLVNAAVTLGVTLLPDLSRTRYDYEISAGLTVWITTAAVLHTVGALGPYETIGWYDQVTHTVSATLVAGLGYAVVQALDHSSADLVFPTYFRVLCILVFVLAFGVVWEILEFGADGLATILGMDAVLSQYGLRDSVLDLAFNTAGAILVALWGTRYFDGVSDFLSRRLRTS